MSNLTNGIIAAARLPPADCFCSPTFPFEVIDHLVCGVSITSARLMDNPRPADTLNVSIALDSASITQSIRYDSATVSDKLTVSVDLTSVDLQTTIRYLSKTSSDSMYADVALDSASLATTVAYVNYNINNGVPEQLTTSIQLTGGTLS